ncbi:MAG: response regulator [Desulfobacterales bacterium]|nr:response regulator [Desulfobacterales bacterium]
MKPRLREKLLIPVVLVIIAGMAMVITHSYISSTDAIQKEVGRSLTREVRLTARLMDEWLISRKTDLSTWSFQQVLVEALTESGYYGKSAREGAAEFLASLEEGYPYYDLLFLMDPGGRLRVLSHQADLSNVIVTDRGYFKKAMTGALTISDVIVSRESGKQIFVVAAPVKKDGEIVGALGGAVELSAFSALFVDQFKLGREGFAFLADARGKIIAASGRTGHEGGDISLYDHGREMLARKNGLMIYQHAGATRIAGLMKIRRTNWLFVETQSLDEAFAASREAGQYGVFVGMIILCIVAFTIILLFRFTIYPRINALLKLIGRVEGGNLDARLEKESRPDEIGVMTNAFIAMIERLKYTLDDLTREIDERKRAEGQLAAHRDNLEVLVKDRTLELEKEIGERKRVEETLRSGESRLLRQNETLLEQARYRTLYKGDLSHTLRQLTEATARTLDVARVSIWLFNRAGTRATCAEMYERNAGLHSNGAEMSAADYPLYFKALESERTISARDAFKDPRTMELAGAHLPAGGVASLLDASIRVSGKMVGVARHEHVGPPRRWRMDERNFAASIADFVSLALETTERMEAENTKKDLEKRLHQAEKMEAIGSLAGGVAHDLNNILSGVVSYPELLLMQIPDDDPLRKPVSIIHNSGMKAAAIVQDLLTLARRGVAVTEVVNLNDIIDEHLRSPEYDKQMSFHPGVEVVKDLEPGLLNIIGSPVHLSKTVMNLVSNASEAMPDGGTLSIRTRNQYVDRPISGYDTVEEGDYIILAIADSGIGISREDIHRIFEPFYTKKKMGRSGTGLGMAVVWGAVKDHKGYIDYESVENEGTSFTLYFPVTRGEVEKEKDGLELGDYLGSGESVLVVDDVKEQRLIASSILSELGYAVTAVASGEKAVEYMNKNFADLIVLDMIMDPGIDGLDAYREIIRIHPGQKAIISSGFSETDRIKKAMRLGVGQYIKKPYTIEKIAVAVKKELDK